MKYYAIANFVVYGMFWNADRKVWASEDFTLFTEHGKDTYKLPECGKWIYVARI